MAQIILRRNIELSIGEKEIVKCLMEGADLTETQAIDEVVSYKREQALHYQKKGNFELAKFLLQQIDEWDESREEDFKNTDVVDKDVKIFIPGQS